MRFLLIAALVIAIWAPVSFAQGARALTNRLREAEQEHQQNVENALNGRDVNRQPQQAPAAAQPGDAKSGWITRKAGGAGGRDVRLYFAYPAGVSKAKPAPGLLVIQEWWGVNEDIQERTREFAAKGFYAVAPDLYYGKVTDDATQAGQLKQSMTNAAAMVAMKTGLDLMAEEIRNGIVDSKHVGVIGWCMGGEQALLLSLNDPRIKATAIFYGPLVTDSAKLKSIQGPVLGIFGNTDTGPAPADVEKFKSGLQAAGKTDVTIYQFDGVGHAFASKSAEKMGLYNEEKSKDAWAKAWSWLDEKLPRK